MRNVSNIFTYDTNGLPHSCDTSVLLTLSDDEKDTVSGCDFTKCEPALTQLTDKE